MSKAWEHLTAADLAAGNDPKLHQRVQLLKLSVTYIFLYNWDSYQSQASAEHAAWPISNSIDEVGKQFKQSAVANGIEAIQLPLPADAMRALQ